MKTILINCCFISPYRGSEWSVSWNHVKAMSRFYKIIVLYGSSGSYIGDNEDLQNWLKDNNIENVEFVYVKPNKLTLIGEYLNRKGFIYAHFPAFKLWQKDAYKVALNILKNKNIDIIHRLGPIGYREPGFLWKLNVPYVWGSIGGFEEPSKELWSVLIFKQKIKRWFHAATNKYQSKHNKRVRLAMKRSDIILAATSGCVDVINKLYHRNAIHLPENGIFGNICLNKEKFLSSIYRFISVSRLDCSKAVVLQVEALGRIKDRGDWKMDIVGDGPEKKNLEKRVKDLGLEDKITFWGSVDRNQVFELFNRAHLHVLSSIAEGNPTVIIEAMSQGVPTLAIDHMGMHDTIKDGINGVKVQVAPPDIIIEEISIALRNLLDNPYEFERLANGVLNTAHEYSWNNRIEFYKQIYDSL